VVHGATINWSTEQVHLLEQLAVSSIVMHILEEWIALDLRRSGASLFVGTFQPLE
jgi:hypothetical protein